MSKKRPHSPAPPKRSDAALQNPNGEKRLKPLARNLLFLAVIILALGEVLYRAQVIDYTAAAGTSVLALLAAVGALWAQLRGFKGKGRLK